MSILFWRKKEEPTKKYFLAQVPQDKVEQFYTMHANMIKEHNDCFLERYKFWRYVVDSVIPKIPEHTRLTLDLRKVLRPCVYVEIGINEPAPAGYIEEKLDETNNGLQVFLLSKKEPDNGN